MKSLGCIKTTLTTGERNCMRAKIYRSLVWELGWWKSSFHFYPKWCILNLLVKFIFGYLVDNWNLIELLVKLHAFFLSNELLFVVTISGCRYSLKIRTNKCPVVWSSVTRKSVWSGYDKNIIMFASTLFRTYHSDSIVSICSNFYYTISDQVFNRYTRVN